MVVKAIKYSNALDEDGNPSSDPHTGGLIIDTTDMQVLIAPVTAILRKALLCNLDDDPGMRIVIDFQRESMPITSSDILVPVFPLVQDMILIKGDDPDPWLAKVLAIQERAKTCKIWYYMEDTERPDQQLHVPYLDIRQAQDIVSWDSILCVSNGEWRGDTWLRY